jgi:endonuclease YncB( thermonuclease family)
MGTAAVLLCLVVGISDGDTLTARCDAADGQPAATIKVRLAEIDAPEMSQPHGSVSRQHLAALCFRKRAEIRPRARDRYGRTVAHVAGVGVDASAEQVRAGLAWAFLRYLTDPRIREIEALARTERRGLWADTNAVAPWDWRAH